MTPHSMQWAKGISLLAVVSGQLLGMNEGERVERKQTQGSTFDYITPLLPWNPGSTSQGQGLSLLSLLKC
jgi:hypothetical protein